MINYALSLILFITVIPSKETLHKTFEEKISKVSVSFSENNLTQAKIHAFEAYEMANDYSYDWGVTKALFVLAYLHEQDLQYEKSLPYYFEALNQYDAYDSQQSILDKSKVLFNLGCIMMVNDKYKEAIEFYDQGITFAQKHFLTDMLLDNLHNKIIVCTDAGLHELAMQTIELKNLSIDDTNLPEILKTINEKGVLYEHMGLFDKAKNQYLLVLKKELKSPSSSFSGKAHINLGNIFHKEGRFYLAKTELETALVLAETEQNFSDIFQIHQSLSIIEKSLGNMNGSLIHAEASVNLISQVQKTKENIAIFSQISQLYLELENIEKGKYYANMYTSEISNLLERQQKLNSIGNQYKIDFITSSYFNKIEKRQRLYVFLSIIGSLIGCFMLYLLFQHYKKVQIAKLIREQMNSVSFDLED